MKVGQQIAHIPTHANGDVGHDDTEFGFVTSQSTDGTHFCRYWSKHAPLILRTQSCSEKTYDTNLIKYSDVFPQILIDEELERLGYTAKCKHRGG